VRALVFIEDPGAANFLLPVLPALAARGVDIELRASGAAQAYTQQKRGVMPAMPEADAQSLLAALEPDIVLIGTSENEDTYGLKLVEAARCRAITTVGVVDILANADRRFRGRGQHALAFAPDLILTADAPTRQAFVALGHPAANVIATGHPHFDDVRTRARALNAEGRDHARARCIPHAPADRSVCVFVSEVSTGLNPSQYRKSDAYTLHGDSTRVSRTEIVLQEFLAAVAGLPTKPYVVLRLHPKNTREELADFVPKFDAISEGGNPLDIVFSADAVVGMSSMLLFEAALVGRPTLAILPRAVEASWLPAEAAGVVPIATTRDQVRALVKDILLQDKGPSRASEINNLQAAERVVNAVFAAISSVA
jgi:hypothetical protein